MPATGDNITVGGAIEAVNDSGEIVSSATGDNFTVGGAIEAVNVSGENILPATRIFC